VVVDGEAQIVHRDLEGARDAFLQERADLHGPRLARAEDLDDLLQRPAGVHDVFDDDDILPRHVRREVPEQAHVARRAGARTVGRDLEKIERHRRLQPLGQIAEEEDRSLEDSDEQRRTPLLVPVELAREALDPVAQRRRVDQGAAELHRVPEGAIGVYSSKTGGSVALQ
jgi:hypothetical protein